MTTFGFSKNASLNLPSRTLSHVHPTQKISYFSKAAELGLAFRPPLADCNGNSVPDTCDLADWNTDGYVDLADYAGFQRCFQQSTAECLAAFDRASLCGEGIDLHDYAVFHAQLTGPPSGP